MPSQFDDEGKELFWLPLYTSLRAPHTEDNQYMPHMNLALLDEVTQGEFAQLVQGHFWLFPKNCEEPILLAEAVRELALRCWDFFHSSQHLLLR